MFVQIRVLCACTVQWSLRHHHVKTNYVNLSGRSDSLLRAENGLEAAGSDVEEDYFEEYHLPNTHENAFVRHRSFRRKVELTPIDAPDAEKIEGLVRTGELERHGSMRRKIVPNVKASDADDVGLYKVIETDDEEVKPSMREFNEDFRQIEEMMDDNGLGEVDLSNTATGGLLEENLEFRRRLSETDTPKMLLMRGKNTFTSTPNSAYASTADYTSIDLSASLHDRSLSKKESSDDNDLECLSIEQSTMTKVKECMDFSKCKDIYSLTGKLQDMLTAVEVEEVLNNSHRYRDYIDSGILEALFNNISEQMSISGEPMSISLNKSDTGKVECERNELTEEQLQLQRQIKQKLLMEELAMDSLPCSVERESGMEAVVMRCRKSRGADGAECEESRFNTIERRKSVRVSSTGLSQEEVEGVFIESDFKDSKLKLLTAPSIDLLNSGSQDDLDVSDISSPFHLGEENNAFTDIKQLSVEHQKDGNGINVPSILITRTESSRGEDGYTDNSSVNNLYLEEEPLTPTSDTTSLDFNDPRDFAPCRPSNGE